LELQLGGLTAGTQHDRLAITGAATLDGTVNASLINGFVPTPGQTFQFLTYASRTGVFATINDTDPDDGITYTTTYNPIDATLNATATPPGIAPLALAAHQPGKPAARRQAHHRLPLD
jgi:hypothetical protein